MSLDRGSGRGLGHLLFLLAFLAMLEALVLTGTVSALILSKPTDVAARLVADLATRELWESMLVTLIEVGVALVLALVIGFLLGLGFWRYDGLRRALEPSLVAFYSAPAILFYPVFLTLVGPGTPTVIAMAVLLGSVPIAINVAVGLAGIDAILRKVGRSFGASSLQMFRYIQLPAAVPTIVTGFRLGLTFALIGVISLQFLLNSGGLGKLVSWRYFVYDTDGVYSAIVLISVIAIGINAAVSGFERRIRRRWA